MTIVTDCFRHGWTAYGDEPILIVELDAVDRHTIEQWLAFTIDLRSNWPDAAKPIYSIMDLSKNDVSMTHLAQKGVHDLSQYNPDLITHTGLVTQQSVLGTILNTTTTLLSRTMKTFNIRVFNNHDKAFQWLVGLMEQNQH